MCSNYLLFTSSILYFISYHEHHLWKPHLSIYKQFWLKANVSKSYCLILWLITNEIGILEPFLLVLMIFSLDINSNFWMMSLFYLNIKAFIFRDNLCLFFLETGFLKRKDCCFVRSEKNVFMVALAKVV